MLGTLVKLPVILIDKPHALQQKMQVQKIAPVATEVRLQWTATDKPIAMPLRRGRRDYSG